MWNQYYPPPPWYYPPSVSTPPPMPMSNSAKEFRQWMKAMEEWKKMQSGEKKDDKKDVDKKKERSFSAIEMFLLLVGTSPLVAILYKTVIIPALLK